MTEGNSGQPPADRTPSRDPAPSGLDRVREAARRDPSLRFTCLLHHVFGRFAARERGRRGQGKPETFDFLGFTHACGTTRTNGRFRVLRQTIAKRLRAKVREVREWLMAHRHDPVSKLGTWLRSVVQGYFNYHAVPCNGAAMETFRREVGRAWLHVLRRRSQKGRHLTWDRASRLFETWLPKRVWPPILGSRSALPSSSFSSSSLVLDSPGARGEESRTRTTDEDEDDWTRTQVSPGPGAMLLPKPRILHPYPSVRFPARHPR